MEENGFETRTVTPVKPPQIEYALTELGEKFLNPVRGLAEWIGANSDQKTVARSAYLSVGADSKLIQDVKN